MGAVMCIFSCACGREQPVAVSPPRSEGVPSARTEALPATVTRAALLAPEDVKDITLPAPIMEALRAYNPEFNVWTLASYPPDELNLYPYSAKSLPYAVFGDYDGDGMEDVVLAGHDKEANIVMVLFSAATGYHIVEVRRTPYYARAREKGKELSPAVSEILLFQREGCRYSVGDMAIRDIRLETDGFVLDSFKRFDPTTAEFVRAGDRALYRWDPSFLKFHSEPLEDSNDESIDNCVVRSDFEKLMFEKRTAVRPIRGASFVVAVKSSSGEWLEQNPVQTRGGIVYYEISAGAELRTTYSCAASDPYGVKYWKVAEIRRLSPLQGERLAPGVAGDIPNPVISRVLPVGTSFGYHWRAPDSAVEIRKDAVFSYACQDGRLAAVFTVVP